MASSAPDAAAAPQDGALEALIRRDRAVTLAGLAILCTLAWVYLARGAGLEMDGMAMAPRAWDLAHWALMIAMWWVMMIAMMVPAAAPTILLYARVHRHAVARDDAERLAPTGAFAAGYLLVWLAASIAAAALYWGLERAAAVSPMGMALRGREVAGALLIAVGLYQLSPLKQACLAHCRAPAAFLARHWRPHASGALRLGAMHGLFCIGCCWLLMALLFVGGVMDLAWIAALTALVMVEKLLPASRWLGPASAAILIGWGAATLIA